jgi:hypothetical protein
MGRIGIGVASVALLVAVLVTASWNAVPGDVLQPVRAATQEIGFAHYTLEDVDALEQEARAHVKGAEAAVDENRNVTLRESAIALQLLVDARRILEEVPPPDKAIRSAWIEGLERRATGAIGEVEDIIRGSSES